MASNFLTTSQAAKLLGVSRQHIVNLCNRGELDFVMAGSHRRIPASALMEPELRPEQARSLWLHRAVLGHLALDPDRVLNIAQSNLDNWRSVHAAGTMARKYLDQWQEIIDQGAETVARALVEISDRANELRVNSPFAGVLSDLERHNVMAIHRSSNTSDSGVA